MSDRLRTIAESRGHRFLGLLGRLAHGRFRGLGLGGLFGRPRLVFDSLGLLDEGQLRLRNRFSAVGGHNGLLEELALSLGASTA